MGSSCMGPFSSGRGTVFLSTADEVFRLVPRPVKDVQVMICEFGRQAGF